MTLPDSLIMPDGTRYRKATAVFHRVNHDPHVWRIDPEVFRLNPFHHVVLTEPIQFLWRDMNPHLTITQMTAMMGNALAFTNFTGVPGRNNYLTNDVGYDKDPRFDIARVCGGAILKEKYIKPNMPYSIPQISETRRGDVVYFEAIDTREPLPKAYEVMQKPWLYFEAVNVARGADGKPVIHKMKSNWGVPVYVPLLVSQDSYYPVELCTKLPDGVAVLPSVYQYP